MAGDLVLRSVEAREVGENQGLPAVQLLAELGGPLGVYRAVRALAPAPAVNRVPLVMEVDLQLALALRVGALEFHLEL